MTGLGAAWVTVKEVYRVLNCFIMTTMKNRSLDLQVCAVILFHSVPLKIHTYSTHTHTVHCTAQQPSQCLRELLSHAIKLHTSQHSALYWPATLTMPVRAPIPCHKKWWPIEAMLYIFWLWSVKFCIYTSTQAAAEQLAPRERERERLVAFSKLQLHWWRFYNWEAGRSNFTGGVISIFIAE